MRNNRKIEVGQVRGAIGIDGQEDLYVVTKHVNAGEGTKAMVRITWLTGVLKGEREMCLSRHCDFDVVIM